MAQSNLTLVGKQKKCKKYKPSWKQTIKTATKPIVVFHYDKVSPQLPILPPKPTLVNLVDHKLPILPPKPTLVNLVDHNSLHIPICNTKTNTNTPNNITAESTAKIAKNTAANIAKNIVRNTTKGIPANTAQNIAPNSGKNITTNTTKHIAANTVKNISLKMAKKKNKAKKLAAINAKNVAGNATVSTPNQVGNPPGNTNQQISNTNPEPPKVLNYQLKKKWLLFQAKLNQKNLKGISKNVTRKNSDDAGNEPGTSGVTQNPQPSDDVVTLTPQAGEAPTTTVTAGTNQGSTIPVLEHTTNKPSITLKTKQTLQQEMVKQRLNWIKPAANVPGTSAAPQKANQRAPLLETPPMIAAVQASLPANSTSGSTLPTLENRKTELNPRANAGSFFTTSVPPSKASKALPRGLDIYNYRYPKGIPRSFLLQQKKSLEAGGQPITADSPIWPGNVGSYPTNTPTSVQPPVTATTGDNTNPAKSPIFVQTESPADVQQPYSPSDIYSEQGNNPEPSELDSESSEQNQAGQKRLSAFQRLGPLSQPKKPKLTINLNLKKEQPVREVVNEKEDDPDKYSPVHLRKDIIMSADETVTKYLKAWPWRKNVGKRRSVSARSSKSAMILEQEQMEEWYEKDNRFFLISVKGYPSTWTKDRVLDAVLDSVRGYSLIPCFTEFYQQECKFLVLRCRSALIVLHKTGFYIHKDGVELTVTITVTDLTLYQIDFIPRIILRKRMVMGYMDKKLNLSAFTLQEDISHFIYFPLNRLSNQSEFIQLQSGIDWDHLLELDLSHNRLTSISGFDLHNVAPNLKHLNLSHNRLEKITVLLSHRQLPLKTLHLEGNPLCHDYIDPDHYVKVIRMMFPAVVEIDGVPIHGRGELPNHKQNYCPEEAQEVSEKFLEIFFPLLDSGPDHRSLVQGMYDDDATLTVTYCPKLRYSQIYRNFRNLFLYARFLDEGETDSVVGAMAITKLINRWPHTEHDPFTFTVDVLYHTESTTILRTSGVLKLTAETLAEDEHLLSFTRTVVLHSEDDGEYKIHNEMVYWEEPTAAAARSAFRVNTISQKNFNLKIESTTDEDLRDKFLKIFMKLTTMDKKISERCLEINNWNFKLALEHFTKLLKSNKLDSLTQEEPAASASTE